MRRVTILAGLMILSGCAGNTLAQDLAWARVEKCKGLGTELLVTRVDPNGTIWYQFRGPRTEFEDCLRAAAQEQAAGQRLAASTPLPVAAASVAPGPVLAPTWKVGDEWAFRYESPVANGSYVWSVSREEALDGVPHYVLKTGTREMFFRKTDLAFTEERVDGKAVILSRPSRLRYAWPLEVGKTWDQAFRDERPVDRQTTDREDAATIEGEEKISVPAGTFKTFRLVYRNKRTGSIRYEEWYSPEIRQVVMLRERLETGLRVRELISFRLR